MEVPRIFATSERQFSDTPGSWLKAVAIACAFLVSSSALHAATITFVPTNLADTTPGEDLWLYEYHISGFTFAASEGFSISFDRALYKKLQSPPPLVNAGWDVLTLQPDLALSSNGLYDAVALRAAPSLANDFKVTAVWLGTGTPAAQPFTIYNASFTPIAQGQTALVPEPATSLLLLMGAMAAGTRRLRRRSR